VGEAAVEVVVAAAVPQQEEERVPAPAGLA
jgi:hypothetical protein